MFFKAKNSKSCKDAWEISNLILIIQNNQVQMIVSQTVRQQAETQTLALWREWWKRVI